MLERQQEYVVRVLEKVEVEMEEQIRVMEREARRTEVQYVREETRFDRFFDWLSEELTSDGYIQSPGSHYTFELKDEKATINDDTVKEKDLKKYQKKYEEVFDRPMRSRLTIEN